MACLLGKPWRRITISTLLAVLALGCSNPEPPDEFGEEGQEQRDRIAADPNDPVILRDYGQYVVAERKLEREAALKPWSSYWLPLRDKWVFKGKALENGPLEKFDTYMVKAHGTLTHASYYEEKNLYRPSAETWEGHCHAWAMASIMVPEPKDTIERNGVKFTVKDQKALITKLYDQYAVNYYGQPFVDHTQSQWSNIQPHLFHRFAVAEIVENGRPFIMNKVPGREVWNIPVYKITVEVKRSEPNSSVYDVKMTTVGAAPLNEPSDKKGTENEINVFTYRLFTKKDVEGRDILAGGEWTGASIDQHPSVLIPMPRGAIGYSSKNLELNIHREKLLELLGL